MWRRRILSYAICHSDSLIGELTGNSSRVRSREWCVVVTNFIVIRCAKTDCTREVQDFSPSLSDSGLTEAP